MSRKADEWERFSKILVGHIEHYALPQYGDYGEAEDLLGPMSADDCMEHLRQYVRRYGSGVRGECEELRDLLKIAHFAGVAYMRRTGVDPK
jgi:hypothetical protein